MTAEQRRMEEPDAWRFLGPYLAERQWGSVREDYSEEGSAWEFTTYEQAAVRAYRWGEDGIAGVCDREQRLCLSLALWNGKDKLLKERLFGLSGKQGNHGEDVKECYYYLDATPSHSYLKYLYKYPQQAFPYAELVQESRRRGLTEGEFELPDCGAFEQGRYFDVFVEYAKESPEDLLMRITVCNRGDQEAEVHVLPHLWFRNTWSFGLPGGTPQLAAAEAPAGCRHVLARHDDLGTWRWYAEGAPELLFCDNETNTLELYGDPDGPRYPKDAIQRRVVRGDPSATRPDPAGSKCCAWYPRRIAPGGSAEFRVRLSREPRSAPFEGFDAALAQRALEADAFYAEIEQGIEGADARLVHRQALAGMIWSRQFYYYDVERWLDGDPGQPAPPKRRQRGRNADWRHLNNADIISMPDKWEYPWYAAWDLAFHCLPLSLVDPEFAKQQLVLMTREWYMHPNGQLPAYEWSFGDANPPVHAWATWRVFQMDRRKRGDRGDLAFLERVFHKLLLNFTWWVNRKDEAGNNIFQGGFLGLDNIGLFNRSEPLPGGGRINQADGTSWMAMYSLNMLRIALELALHNPVYEDVATKFFEHFLGIAHAMTNIAGKGLGLWDEEDEFYYDVLELPGRHDEVLKIRSMVGLIPLFAVETLEPEMLENLPGFRQRLEWVLKNKPELCSLVSRWFEPRRGERRLLSLLRGHRMKCLLRRMLDPEEFLSEYGVRALSRHHRDHPVSISFDHTTYSVRYTPGESDSGLFGGNSNWRGPLWFPVNYLIIESLQKFHHYYGDDFRVECPTGSGQFMTLLEVAEELTRRLTRLFLKDATGARPIFGGDRHSRDPHFRDYILFHEYFHGETGKGLGASHQTGWTGLVAKLLQPRRPVH